MRYVAAAAAAAALLATPAGASQTVVAYNDGTRGFVNVTVSPDLTGRAAADDVHLVNGECHYDHVLGSRHGTTVAVVGRVVAGARVLFGGDGAPDTTAPVGTVLTCVVKTDSGVVRELTGTALGPAAALAGTVDLPAEGITICVRASALFTDGRFVPLEERCRASTPPVR